jgi:hypothetical protein
MMRITRFTRLSARPGRFRMKLTVDHAGASVGYSSFTFRAFRNDRSQLPTDRLSFSTCTKRYAGERNDDQSIPQLQPQPTSQLLFPFPPIPQLASDQYQLSLLDLVLSLPFIP